MLDRVWRREKRPASFVSILDYAPITLHSGSKEFQLLAFSPFSENQSHHVLPGLIRICWSVPSFEIWSRALACPQSFQVPVTPPTSLCSPSLRGPRSLQLLPLVAECLRSSSQVSLLEKPAWFLFSFWTLAGIPTLLHRAKNSQVPQITKALLLTCHIQFSLLGIFSVLFFYHPSSTTYLSAFAQVTPP